VHVVPSKVHVVPLQVHDVHTTLKDSDRTRYVYKREPSPLQ
jgi:hypothetical protein